MKLLKKLTQFFFFLFLIVFPFGQLARVPFSILGPEIRVYLTDIFLFLALSSWLIWHGLKKEKFTWPYLGQPILAFFGVGLISLLVNSRRLMSNELLIAFLYLFRWLSYAGLYFFIVDFAPRTKTKFFSQENFARIMTSLGVIVALFGLIQYLIWPDLRTFAVAHWDPHYFRVAGSFLEPGFTGLILVFSLSLVVGLLREVPAKSKQRRVLLSSGALIYLAFALTYSRSSYLAYLVAAGVLAWWRRSKKFFIWAVILLLITILLLPRPGGEGVKLERWASIEARIRNWKNSLTIFWHHPLLGVGFNAYRYAQRDYGFLGNDWQENHAGAGADSSLLFVLATTGLLGFGVFFWLWLKVFDFVKAQLSSQFGLVFFASLAGLWLHSLFLNSLFYPWIMAWVWLLLATLEVSKKRSS